MFNTNNQNKLNRFICLLVGITFVSVCSAGQPPEIPGLPYGDDYGYFDHINKRVMNSPETVATYKTKDWLQKYVSSERPGIFDTRTNGYTPWATGAVAVFTKQYSTDKLYVEKLDLPLLPNKSNYIKEFKGSGYSYPQYATVSVDGNNIYVTSGLYYTYGPNPYYYSPKFNKWVTGNGYCPPIKTSIDFWGRKEYEQVCSPMDTNKGMPTGEFYLLEGKINPENPAAKISLHIVGENGKNGLPDVLSAPDGLNPYFYGGLGKVLWYGIINGKQTLVYARGALKQRHYSDWGVDLVYPAIKDCPEKVFIYTKDTPDVAWQDIASFNIPVFITRVQNSALHVAKFANKTMLIGEIYQKGLEELTFNKNNNIPTYKHTKSPIKDNFDFTSDNIIYGTDGKSIYKRDVSQDSVQYQKLFTLSSEQPMPANTAYDGVLITNPVPVDNEIGAYYVNIIYTSSRRINGHGLISLSERALCYVATGTCSLIDSTDKTPDMPNMYELLPLSGFGFSMGNNEYIFASGDHDLYEFIPTGKHTQ